MGLSGPFSREVGGLPMVLALLLVPAVALIPGPIPYYEGSECSCDLLEFPWVFCFGQAFDCKDECTTGQDIDSFRCRFGSHCSWSSGSGRGSCFCPDKCTDEDQREDSKRALFMEECPPNGSAWEFPGPCVQNFGDEWRCGFIGDHDQIYQYSANGYSSTNVNSVYLKSFEGEDVSYTPQLVDDCLETATYNGDQTYSYSPEACLFCYSLAPIQF